MTDRLPVVRKEGQNVQIPAGDGLLLRGALNEARIVSVSAAATINFDTWASNTVALQGSGTINTLIGGQKGCTRRMRFTQDGIILGNLTGNIILPGTANIVVKVNDVAEFVSLTNGQWLCFNYSRADGTALVSSGSGSSPASTDALPEGTTNLYFTAARVLATTLAGFASAVGAVTAADTILAALGKLQGTKVDKVDGKGLSTNDYTTAEQTKLAGIATGAQVNTVTSVAARTGDVVLAKGDVGLGNVDNTADTAKPVSTAQQAALDLKAPLASPAFTGKVNAPIATFANYLDKIVTSTPATGTVTLDLSVASVFDLTLTGNTTLAFSNTPTLSGETFSFVVIVRQGSSTFTLSQPSGVTPVTSGGAAVVTPGAGKQKDYIYSTKNGTAWELREGAST